MNDFKSAVKNWLKVSGKDRFWLAKQLFVEKSTVDDWMKKAGVIPSAKAELIKKLMEAQSEDSTSGEVNGVVDLVLRVDAKTFLQFAEWAREDGFDATPDGMAKWAVYAASKIGKKRDAFMTE